MSYKVIPAFDICSLTLKLRLWDKQGLLGVIAAIVLLLIAAWTTKIPHTDDQYN